MYIEAIVLGVVVGFFRGGNLSHMGDHKIRFSWLAFPALLFYLLPYLSAFFSFELQNLHLYPFISMLLVLWILLFNLRYAGAKIASVGMLLNLFIMSVSDFRMPIDLSGMRSDEFSTFVTAVTNGEIPNYISMTQTRMISRYLGKVIPVNEFYFSGQILSIGDILASIGVLILVSEMMQYLSAYNLRRRGF